MEVRQHFSRVYLILSEKKNFLKCCLLSDCEHCLVKDSHVTFFVLKFGSDLDKFGSKYEPSASKIRLF